MIGADRYRERDREKEQRGAGGLEGEGREEKPRSEIGRD